MFHHLDVRRWEQSRLSALIKSLAPAIPHVVSYDGQKLAGSDRQLRRSRLAREVVQCSHLRREKKTRGEEARDSREDKENRLACANNRMSHNGSYGLIELGATWLYLANDSPAYLVALHRARFGPVAEKIQTPPRRLRPVTFLLHASRRHEPSDICAPAPRSRTRVRRE